MKYLLSIVILVTACSGGNEEVPWFMGSWISDTELTIRENVQLRALPAEDMVIVRGMLGSLRWEVSASTLTVLRSELDSRADFDYSIRAVSDSELKISSKSTGDMTIRKMDKKICADFPTVPGTTPLLVSECFSRYIL